MCFAVGYEYEMGEQLSETIKWTNFPHYNACVIVRCYNNTVFFSYGFPLK